MRNIEWFNQKFSYTFHFFFCVCVVQFVQTKQTLAIVRVLLFCAWQSKYLLVNQLFLCLIEINQPVPKYILNSIDNLNNLL